MRILYGLRGMGRDLPAGTLRLLVLAGLISLAVFGSGAWAEDDEGGPLKDMTGYIWIEKGENVIGDKSGLTIGDKSSETTWVYISDGGRLTAEGGTTLVGNATVVGGKLQIGDDIKNTGSGGIMSTSFLDRQSSSSTIRFQEVEIYRYNKDFNLGGMNGKSQYRGGIYVSDYLEVDYVDVDGVALYAQKLSTLNRGEDYQTSLIRSAGDVTLAKGGHIILEGNEYGVGGIVGQTNPEKDTYEYAFVMNDGKLEMTSHFGAQISMKDIKITGGKATLSADEVYDGITKTRSWKNDAPAIIGGGGKAGETGSVLIDKNADVALGDYGMIRTKWENGGDLASKINFNGGVITMSGAEGRESVLYAAADAAGKSDSKKTESSIVIDGDAVLNVAGNGAIISRSTDFRGGDINIDGKLTVAGAAADAATVLEGVKSAVEKWGDFRFNGGDMTLGENGIADFVTGNMTLTASGGSIDGALRIVDADAKMEVGGSAYATNLTVGKGGSFSVSDLAVDTLFYGSEPEENTSIAGSNRGANVNGTLVVTGSVAAAEKVATGSLTIGEGGALTAKSSDFLKLDFGEPDKNDNNKIKLAGYTVSNELKTALTGSQGTLNLKSENPKVAPNISKNQYYEIKNSLGLKDGHLNLMGVMVDDWLKLAVDDDGKIDTYVSNPSAMVEIDAKGKDEIIFDEYVAVKDIDLEKGDKVSFITLEDDAVFTGDGVISSPIIKGGLKPDIDVNAKGDLTLGIAGNDAKQGGLLGDIALTTGGRTEQNLNVNDGEFRVGDIVAGKDIAGNDSKKEVDVSLNVFGGGRDKTRLETDGVDFSAINPDNTTTVNVKGATLKVADAIKLNGNKGSGISLNNNAYASAKSIEGGSYITIDGGSDLAVAGDIVLADDASSTVHIGNGSLTANRLELGDQGGYVLVCDKGSKGSLVLGEVALKGGTIFSDPAWLDGVNSIGNATSVTVGNFKNSTMDGNVIVGQNSYFSYGTTDTTWLPEQIRRVGSWGPSGSYHVTAALGIYKPLVIGEGQSLVVDGNLVSFKNADGDMRPTLNGSTEYKASANTARFADNSLLVVNAGAMNMNNAALTSENKNGKLEIEQGAKIYFYNAKKDTEFKLLENLALTNTSSGVIGENAWISSANMNDSEMVRVVIDKKGSAYIAKVSAMSAHDVYGDRGGSDGSIGIIDDLYGNGNGNSGGSNGSNGSSGSSGQGSVARNDVDSDNAGIRFSSRATSKAYNGDDLNRQVATIEGAAQLAAVGGAPLQAFNVMRMNHEALRKRFSFSNGLIPHPGGHDGMSAREAAVSAEPEGAWGSMIDMSRFNVEGKRFVSVWAAPVYQHSGVSGAKVGNFENKYKSNLGGANLGLDVDLGNNIRFGLTGNIGGGKAKSNGGILAYTENSIDYAGIGGYAAWSTCNFSLFADGGYTHVKNKLRQDNWLGGVSNRGTAKIDAWNFGLTGEFLVVAGSFDIVPHAGLRYEGIGTKGYDVSSNDGVIFNVGKDTQHILSIPLGVTFSRDFNVDCRWRVTPYVDMGALFSVGNRDYKTTVNMPTFQGSNFKSRIVDAAAFNGSVGVNTERGRFFGGVNYNVLASNNQTAQSLWATFGINF